MNVVVEASSRMGRGIFAAFHIPHGTKILQMQGDRLSFAETIQKGEHEANAMQVDQGLYFDLTEPGVLANHSCDPNAGVTPDFWLVSLRDIAVGEEITWDYSTSMKERWWTMRCDCRTKLCRGVVLDFDLLPAERQHHYLALDVVQQFIVDELIPVSAAVPLPLPSADW